MTASAGPKQGPPVSFRSLTVEAALAQRAEEGQKPGIVASRTLARYFDALAREQGRLGIEGAEWDILKAATITRHFEERGPYRLHYGVLDAAESGDLGEADAATVQSLVAKLKALTPLQELAVIDLLEGWRRSGDTVQGAQ